MSNKSDSEEETLNANIISHKDGQYGRRHWEVEFTEGDKKEKEITVKVTRNLESRKSELKLEEKLGKIQTVTKETTKENEAGYTCEVCNCVMKDSQTYLDHINGKKHNRNLGMNMKVEKIGVDRIKAKLEAIKTQKERKVENFDDFEKKFEDEMKRKEEAKKKKIEKKEMNKIIEKKLAESGLLEDDNKDENEEMRKMMGLPGNFVSKKIKRN